MWQPARMLPTISGGRNMTNDFPIHPCPKCGSKNRLETMPHKLVWCAECGAISCPHCGSTRIINGKVKSWELPSFACQLCGWRTEIPTGPWKPMSIEQWKATGGRRIGKSHRSPCKKCGKDIDNRTKLFQATGLCLRCSTIANAKKRLKKAVAKAAA